MVRAVGAVLLVCATLSGCASVALHSFLGKDVDAVIARYGPPVGSFALPNGRRGFRWVFASTRTAAAQAPLSSFVPLKTASIRQREHAASAGLVLGGTCTYTLIGEPAPDHGHWLVASYEQPRFDCD